MKYSFILISLLFSLSAVAQTVQSYDNTEPLLDDSIREKPETEDYQNEEEIQREEETPAKAKYDPNDPLGEFKGPRYDTGNGRTTNQKNFWPEP